MTQTELETFKRTPLARVTKEQAAGILARYSALVKKEKPMLEVAAFGSSI